MKNPLLRDCSAATSPCRLGVGSGHERASGGRLCGALLALLASVFASPPDDDRRPSFELLQGRLLAKDAAPAERPIASDFPAEAEASFARSGPFDAQTVVEMARMLAKSPFVPPKTSLPPPLANLQYDQYRDIRFRPSATIWAAPSRAFRLQLLPLGYLFTTPVEIAIVADGTARHLPYRADLFTAGTLVPAPLPTQDIGFSGLRLLYPINHPSRFDEVAVFQGASYFRSLGRGPGLRPLGARPRRQDRRTRRARSSRSSALLGRANPGDGATHIVVHALLDSPSVTGAYRFAIRPGHDTVMDVEATLFPRVDLADVGLAPGTSMFFFDQRPRAASTTSARRSTTPTGCSCSTGAASGCGGRSPIRRGCRSSAFMDQQPAGLRPDPARSRLRQLPGLRGGLRAAPEPVGRAGRRLGAGRGHPRRDPDRRRDPRQHRRLLAPPRTDPRRTEFRLAYRLSWGDEPSAAADRLRVIATARGRADVQAPDARAALRDRSSRRAAPMPRPPARCRAPR